jgi:OOP family OmpA-OmpF porin
MRVKPSSVPIMAMLGLLASGCGPIAFSDSINFELSKAEAEPPKQLAKLRARLSGNRIEIDEKIQFEYDSHEIVDVSHALLNDIVQVLQDNPQIKKLDIVGYTSSEGSKAHNEKLSTDRAASVLKYLVEHGIDAGRLTSQGKGPADPVASNDTEEGKIANRRVEFHVIEPAGAAAKPGARAKPGRAP